MKIYIIFISLLLATTSIMAQDINDAVIAQYRDKSKNAWDKAQKTQTREIGWKPLNMLSFIENLVQSIRPMKPI